jgi:hypothetical protein
MSNATTLVLPESHLSEAAVIDDRERLIDERDALHDLVKEQKKELEEALTRWRDQGQGSPRAMRQLMAAIGQGRGQIGLIDIRLAALGSTQAIDDEGSST